MKRYIAAASAIGIVAAVALVAALAMGTGDDSGTAQASEIRTQKGLLAAPAAGDGIDTSSAIGDAPVSIAQAQQAVAGGGLTVTGYGSAATDADAAIVEFYFSRTGYDDKPIPLPEPVEPDAGDGSSSSGSSGSGSSDSVDAQEPAVAPDTPVDSGDIDVTQTEVAPITEADLQPVIDALVGAGVAREDIEFIGQGYADPYYASATLRVTITNLDSADAAIQAGNEAAANLGDIQAGGTNVSYTLSDCAAVERAAMEAAVEDAGDRGTVLAEVLGVGVGGIVGASHYSYAPYGGTPCDTGNFGPIPVAEDVYAPGGGTREVQVFAEISVTYAIQ